MGKKGKTSSRNTCGKKAIKSTRKSREKAEKRDTHKNIIENQEFYVFTLRPR